MEEKRNLAEICTNISQKIQEAKTIAEILEDIIDGEKKSSTMLSIILNNLQAAFNDVEECRNLISSCHIL